MKLLIIFCVIVAIQGQPRPGMPGGFYDSNNPETYEEVRKLLNNGVCEMENCFTLVKINNVAKQVVAGVRYVVNGMFKDTKLGGYYTMNVNIYHVVWENKTELTILSKELIRGQYFNQEAMY